MKYILLVLLSVPIWANEASRIDAILLDIENLRAKNTACEKSLKEKNNDAKKLLVKEINKNKSLSSQVIKLNSMMKNDDSKLKIENLEKQVNNLKNILKIKENKINTLNKKIIQLEKPKVKKKKTLTLVKENTFPKLMMKEETEEKTTSFSPSAFRLLQDSIIYNKINGTKVYEWENKTSFTSNKQSKNWLKVTGYFVDKQWRKAKVELWIKKEHATKR